MGNQTPYFTHPLDITDDLTRWHWTSELDSRELAQVRHATHYATHYANAGTPGHGQFMLINKLAQILDRIGHE